MAGILAVSGIVYCGFLCGVCVIVFLKNGDHFCLFQNTIFHLNSRVLCECLVIKDLQKQRISFDSHKYAPPFLYPRQSNRLAFLFSPPRFTLKNRSAECPESYQPHPNRVKLLSCSDFLETCCVTPEI